MHTRRVRRSRSKGCRAWIGILGAVLRALEKATVRDKTDIFVVSDHGFSTVEVAVDLRDLLKTAGFHAATEFGDNSATGDIMIVPNGGTAFFM